MLWTKWTYMMKVSKEKQDAYKQQLSNIKAHLYKQILTSLRLIKMK